MASADFCGLTRCITAKRAVWSDGSGPVRSLEIGLLDLAPGRFGYGTTRPFLPSVLHRQGAQISPGKNANYRCTSAAFTVGCVPVGFAAMCQLASHPSALTMRFLSVASHLCTRASSRQTLAGLPLPSASGYPAHHESKSVLPQGTSTP